MLLVCVLYVVLRRASKVAFMKLPFERVWPHEHVKQSATPGEFCEPGIDICLRNLSVEVLRRIAEICGECNLSM